MFRVALIAATVFGIGLLAGCGASAPAPRLTPSVAASLRHDLVVVRSAAAGGNRPAALAALSAFSRTVEAQAADGHVPAAELTVFRRVLADARARIYSEVNAPVAVQPAPASTPAPAAGPAPGPRPPGAKKHDHAGKPGGPPPGHDKHGKEKH